MSLAEGVVASVRRTEVPATRRQQSTEHTQLVVGKLVVAESWRRKARGCPQAPWASWGAAGLAGNCTERAAAEQLQLHAFFTATNHATAWTTDSSQDSTPVQPDWRAMVADFTLQLDGVPQPTDLPDEAFGIGADAVWSIASQLPRLRVPEVIRLFKAGDRTGALSRWSGPAPTDHRPARRGLDCRAAAEAIGGRRPLDVLGARALCLQIGHQFRSPVTETPEGTVASLWDTAALLAADAAQACVLADAPGLAPEDFAGRLKPWMDVFEDPELLALWGSRSHQLEDVAL